MQFGIQNRNSEFGIRISMKAAYQGAGRRIGIRNSEIGIRTFDAGLPAGPLVVVPSTRNSEIGIRNSEYQSGPQAQDGDPGFGIRSSEIGIRSSKCPLKRLV